jgi:hypothetical protein
MKRRATNLQAIAIEEMAFHHHLSLFTFHARAGFSRLTNHFSPRMLRFWILRSPPV